MKTRNQLLKEAWEVHKKLKENKKLYTRMDEITCELVDLSFTSAQGVELVDNFRSKNLLWKATGIRRFELKFDEITIGK